MHFFLFAETITSQKARETRLRVSRHIGYLLTMDDDEEPRRSWQCEHNEPKIKFVVHNDMYRDNSTGDNFRKRQWTRPFRKWNNDKNRDFGKYDNRYHDHGKKYGGHNFKDRERSHSHSSRDFGSERIVRIIEEDEDSENYDTEQRSHSRLSGEGENSGQDLHRKGCGPADDWDDGDSTLPPKWESSSDVSGKGEGGSTPAFETESEEDGGKVEEDGEGKLSSRGKGLLANATSLLQVDTITDPVIREKFAKACVSFLKSSLKQADSDYKQTSGERGRKEYYSHRTGRPFHRPYKYGRGHAYRRTFSSSESGSASTSFGRHGHPNASVG